MMLLTEKNKPRMVLMAKLSTAKSTSTATASLELSKIAITIIEIKENAAININLKDNRPFLARMATDISSSGLPSSMMSQVTPFSYNHQR